MMYNGLTLLKAELISMTDEEHQIKAAVNGSLSAFENLYHKYVGRIYSLCYRLCANAAQAEELTQEVFIKAWQKLYSFKFQSKFYTWLHKLASNLVLSSLRKKSLNFTELDEALTKKSDSHHEQLLEHRELHQLIMQLPDGARTILVLHDIEGYQHQEIAEILNISVGTSKAQVHRARKLLREHWQ